MVNGGRCWSRLCYEVLVDTIKVVLNDPVEVKLEN